MTIHDKIKAWQDWIDSLATAGGGIVVLFICAVLTGILWGWTVKHNLPSMETPVFGVFTGFTGALLQAMKGNSSRQQMQDRIETSIIPQSDIKVDGTGTVTVEKPKS